MKKKREAKPRKLTLNRETLQNLESDKLKLLVGGVTTSICVYQSRCAC